MSAISKELLGEINAAYHQLEMKRAEVVYALSHTVFELESGWYSGHYHKGANGDWIREAYPIPVVSVKGLCDIEISFDKLNVSAKLKRAKAIEYSYEKFSKYAFEAYGVEDYLLDFRAAGQSIEEMKQNIAQSDEREIGFAFSFPFEYEREALYAFAKLLRREGFYY